MEERGKYKLIYSTGAVAIMSGVTKDDAIKTAKEKAEEDPNLKLVEVTADKGGITISYR